MAYKGKFIPKNINKYRGTVNNIIYRSLWERRFMKWCDDETSVLKWSSEELTIPYISPVDRRWHRYYPDFYIKIKNKENNITEHLVEIKPKKQTKRPINKGGKRFLIEVRTYSVNEAKWKAANIYCKKRNWTFNILTEDHIL